MKTLKIVRGVGFLAVAAYWLTSASVSFAHEVQQGSFAERKTAWMRQELSLSDAQVSQIQAIFTEKQKRHEERLKIRQEEMKQTHDQISSVLSDEQKTKFEQIIADKKKHMAASKHKKRGFARKYGRGFHDSSAEAVV